MRRRAALLPAALVAATLLVQAAFLVPATPAAADDAIWSVAPATASGQAARDYFRYALAPGAQVTDQVRVSNLGSAPLTFAVYATDAYTTDDGSFALLTAADKPRDVGTWIVLGARAYTVAPGTYLDIPFRLAVPTNASPGDHVGGVIASVVSRQVTGDGQQVNVDRRVAARVYLRVSGPAQPAVEIHSVRLTYDNPLVPFTGGTATVTYQLTNTGNLRLSGTTGLRLTAPFGITLGRTEPVQVPELLPGGTVTVTQQVRGIPATVRLTARVEAALSSGEGALPVSTRAGARWAVPWSLLAILLLLGVLLISARLLRRRSASPTGRLRGGFHRTSH